MNKSHGASKTVHVTDAAVHPSPDMTFKNYFSDVSAGEFNFKRHFYQKGYRSR